ncbi:MAG: Unknown protein [uncultured Sulfurovum sp.]|uniref:Pentapeptide repeat-containing protein n=1 Tax=uncultured Sulfurovum sp. TaxID=269237 RepID=A0A6S6TS49_9BACT|nr:MAG: Unknown protein [uncultured Sulfurovum sp.]
MPILNPSFNANIKNRLYGESFSQASKQQIIEEVETWKSLEVTIFWENLREVKKIIYQNKEMIDFSYFVFPNFELSQKTCNFWEEHEDLSFNKKVNFSQCHFVGDVDFSNVSFKEDVDFYKADFNATVNFLKSTFEKEVNFFGTQFRDESNFYHTVFQEKTNFNEVTFHKKTVFHQVNFIKRAFFSLVSSKYRITFFDCFAKKISFKYSRIENAYFVNNHFEYLNLHGVAIETPFLSDNIIDEAERETFAYIKHFYNKGDDYISANYYYAREMSAYQKQLFPKSNASFLKKTYDWFKKPNLSDKLVFGFSKLASNFGQNIFLPLYWILFSAALFVGLKGENSQNFILFSTTLFLIFFFLDYLFGTIFKKQKSKDLIWLLAQATFSLVTVGLYLHHGTFIADLAKVINPVQMFKGTSTYCQGIELSCLLLRVFIATMVYHFIIASQQGVKR